jgi:hypothetical protein
MSNKKKVYYSHDLFKKKQQKLESQKLGRLKKKIENFLIFNKQQNAI